MLLVYFILPLVLASEVPCPGGKHECPESATCCQLPDKSYGCCPLKNAVCCDDHIHCCPEGSRCEVGMCVKGYSNNTLKAKREKNVCPGGQYTCPDDSTCCINEHSEVYGCCLVPDGVCCSDLLHCCPKDTLCDISHEQCVGNGYKLQMQDFLRSMGKPKKATQKLKEASEKTLFVKSLTPVKPTSSKLSTSNYLSIVCPGGRFQCPDGYTCCQLPTSDWGCCPFSNATCCPDKVHCCPSEMKCDVTSKACIRGDQNVTWAETLIAERIK